MLHQMNLFADIAAADYRDSLTDAQRQTLEAARAILCTVLPGRPVLSSRSALTDYLGVTMGGLRAESFRVLYLDRRNRLIRDEETARGTVDHVPVYVREVLRRALQLDASALILAHNHPSGDPTPSEGDRALTKVLDKAARALGIVLHDHVIAGGERTHSMRAAGDF